jgi:hypothetical protein
LCRGPRSRGTRRGKSSVLQSWSPPGVGRRGNALGVASEPAQYPPPLGPSPIRPLGDRVGGSTKTTNRVARKRAAVSGGRSGGTTVPIAPGSARCGPGTASALVTPTG